MAFITIKMYNIIMINTYKYGGKFYGINKKQVSITKWVAILFMLLLHLFCTKDYQGLFTPLIIIKGIHTKITQMNITKRILKLYINFWIIILLFVVLLGYLTGNSATYPSNIKIILLNVTAISF